MEQDKDGLMTVEEFNLQVNKWSLQITLAAKATLRDKTHGTGNLANYVTRFVDKTSNDSPAYKVKFQFDRYGVFRAYGAGRGYVILNGQIVRGYRVRSVRDIQLKRYSSLASRMLQKGYSRQEVNTAKIYGEGNSQILRTKLDWIDIHIDSRVERLADLCQEYYGDEAAKQILAHLDKIKIVKK
jgi:hypothetical protein